MEPKNDVMQERNIQLFAADREEEEKMNGCAVSRKTIFKEMNRSGKKVFWMRNHSQFVLRASLKLLMAQILKWQSPGTFTIKLFLVEVIFPRSVFELHSWVLICF